MSSRIRGYSLIELLVAIGVLAVGLLSIYASLTYSLKASRHSDQTSQAVALNRQIMDLVRSRQLTPTPELAQRRRVDAPPFADDIAGDPPFERQVEIAPVSTDASRPESRLRRIKVTIFWMEEGGERNVVFEGYQRQP